MSYKKRKGITVNDIAYGKNENQFFMNSSPGNMSPAEMAALSSTKLIGINTNFEVENKKRIEYNNNIQNLDPRFERLESLGMFIVRYKVRIEERKSDLIIPNTSEVLVESRSGKFREKVKDPYRFSQVAVVVVVPKYETELKPGMLVHTNMPKPFGNVDEGIFTYDVEYLHPDYIHEFGPKDVENPDFGYGIVERSRIKFIIHEQGENNSQL